MAKDISLENVIELQMLFGKHVVESYVEMADDPTKIGSNIPLAINGERYEISLRKVPDEPLKPTLTVNVVDGEIVSDYDTERFSFDVDCKVPLYSEEDLKRAGISIRGGNNVVEK